MAIMSDLTLNMEDIDSFLDLESPYMYGEEYLETAASSESTSPIMSSVRLPAAEAFRAKSLTCYA
jgi:hypothetical protein